MHRFGQIAAAVAFGGTCLLAPVSAAAHGQAARTRLDAISVQIVAQGSRFESDLSAASELETMSTLVQRYLVHGHTGVHRQILVRHRDDPAIFDESAGGPVALHWPGRCQVLNLRTHYGPLLRTRPDLTHLRLHRHPAAVIWGLIHEDMHCRIDPYLEFAGQPLIERLRADGASSERLAFVRLVDRMKTLLGEAISDAMAILMMARRDGVDTAREFSETLADYRADRRAVDPEHDTTATLIEVRRILETEPAVLDSDARVFERAILAAQTTFFHTFVQQLDMDDVRIVSSADFAAQVARIPVMLDRARMAYRDDNTPGHPVLAGQGTVARGAMTQDEDDEEDGSTNARTQGASARPGTAVHTIAER